MNLEPKYVEKFEDVRENPHENGTYEVLKNAFIKRASDSSSMRVRKLRQGKEIGDRTPSQFLRPLKNHAGTSINKGFLQILWLACLPVCTENVMAGMRDKPFIGRAK